MQRRDASSLGITIIEAANTSRGLPVVYTVKI